MSRPRTTMQPPVYEDAVCPDCRTALEFGTDGNGKLIEWCPTCSAAVRWKEVRQRLLLKETAQQHKATGFCSHIVRDQGAVPFVCPFPQAATRRNDCDRYCAAHCKANADRHGCRRSQKRTYMRDYMRERYRESRERTARLYGDDA